MSHETYLVMLFYNCIAFIFVRINPLIPSQSIQPVLVLESDRVKQDFRVSQIPLDSSSHISLSYYSDSSN